MRDFTGVSGATDDGLAKDTPAPATRWSAEVANSWLKELKLLITHPDGGATVLNPLDDSQVLVAVGQMVANGFANRQADARFSQIKRVVEDDQGGDNEPYSPVAEAQLLDAIITMIGRAFTSRAVEARFNQVKRVVEDPAGGNSTPYDPGTQAQLLDAILTMIGRAFTDKAVDGRFNQIKRVVEDATGGNTTPYDPGTQAQLLDAILAMIGRAFADRAIDGRFNQIKRVVEDAVGGNTTPYDPGAQTQLLDAILAMIVRATSSLITVTVEAGAEKTISIGGGALIIKQGYVRQIFTSEATVPVAFQTPFPGGCWVVLTQGVISSANIYKDLWTQVIDPTRTQDGFTVQLQSDDDNDHGLAGFDWVAFGN